MKKRRILFLGLLTSLLAACGVPVPPEKAEYIGEWREQGMQLAIEQDGRVVYERVEGNTTTSIDAPLKGFTDSGFDVGVGPMTTTFVVNRAPFQEDGQWKMTVDGVTLTRASR